MPFLRLTRDRRGFENTFLMHADRPGDRPRLLYWYRTAPGILLGRPPLDEDAIRTIEEQHPDIEFDWPAILALSEVMTREEEAPVRPQKQGKRKRDRDRGEEAAVAPEAAAAEPIETASAGIDQEEGDAQEAEEEAPRQVERHVSGLLEELVGREIATRLRARYSEIQARIHEQVVESAQRDAWLARAERLNPDLWLTPDAILEGVRSADTLFDQLRSEFHSSRE